MDRAGHDPCQRSVLRITHLIDRPPLLRDGLKVCRPEAAEAHARINDGGHESLDPFIARHCRCSRMLAVVGHDLLPLCCSALNRAMSRDSEDAMTRGHVCLPATEPSQTARVVAQRAHRRDRTPALLARASRQQQGRPGRCTGHPFDPFTAWNDTAAHSGSRR